MIEERTMSYTRRMIINTVITMFQVDIVSSQNDAVAGLLGRWSWPTENKEY